MLMGLAEPSLNKARAGSGVILPGPTYFSPSMGLVNGWPPVSKRLSRRDPPGLNLLKFAGKVKKGSRKEIRGMREYRLGLDLGSNSIGWCAVELDAEGRPVDVLDAGVRILSPNEEAGRDPQSRNSLAATRRLARGQRRRRQRFTRRRDRLMDELVRAGLMPEDKRERKALEKLDPYFLRKEALDRKLEPGEIGRALFHLNQRRGFKSNRIVDSGNDDKSAMKLAVKALEDRLKSEGSRTLGEFLAGRHGRNRCGWRRKGEVARPVRFRADKDGGKLLYDLYPTRLMIEKEIDAIWDKQKDYNSELLTDELLGRIKRIVIEQRPLKAPIIGNCSLFPDQKRAPKAHPLFQRFRIMQDACQLRIVRRDGAQRQLKMREYDLIVGMLLKRSSRIVEFEKLRKELKLPDDARLNYERTRRKGFLSDETARCLATKQAFGPAWRKFDLDQQVKIAERLLDGQDEVEICSWLRSEFGLNAASAEHVSGIRLPRGYGRFSVTALWRLVEAMGGESRETHDPKTGEVYRRPLTYDEAIEIMGLHHSDRNPATIEERLPYYGEVLEKHVIQWPDAPDGTQEAIGRVPNPTVHIGLNQLRLVVNDLIDEYGPPKEIAIELGRELKLNKECKDRLELQNRENERRNEEFRDTLSKLDLADTHDNRLRLRLYHELPAETRLCVYSGRPIGVSMLFSGEVEIDHVLPYSQTLDDGFANKVLCMREMNREKRNRAPENVWSGDELEDICDRAESLFPMKVWRFAPGAMQRFESEGGFLARQLTDTQHMSRLARSYLGHVCRDVRVSPGRLTAMLRARWGLDGLLSNHNRKNRSDHRHHAIDAFVIACTDYVLLNRISHASGQAEELKLERLFPKGAFPTPFEGYREALGTRLRTIVVSHRQDHGLRPGVQTGEHVTSGQLLDGMAFGLVDEVVDGKRYNLVRRRPLQELSARMIRQVRDERLRSELARVAEDAKLSGRKLKDVLLEFGKEHGIRNVRVLEAKTSFREVRHSRCLDGFEFKMAYETADNHSIEIFKLPSGEWKGEGITVYDANKLGHEPGWQATYPEALLVMRLHRGDMIQANFGDGNRIYRVVRLNPSGNRVYLAEHYEGGALQKRHNFQTDEDPFRFLMPSYSTLKAAGARRVRVDPIGRVHRVVEKR